MQPLKRPFSVSRISAGSRQLLVGPASSSLLGADEGAVLDPGDVGGVGEGEVGVRAAWRRRGARRCRRRPGSGRGGRTPRPSRRTSGRRRAGSGRRSPRPRRAALRAWSARRPRWSCRSFAVSLIRWRFEADRDLMSASSLRIFSVAVACLPSANVTVQSKVLPVSTSTSDGQSTDLIFSSKRFLEARLDRVLGLDVVDHRFPAADAANVDAHSASATPERGRRSIRPCGRAHSAKYPRRRRTGSPAPTAVG